MPLHHVDCTPHCLGNGPLPRLGVPTFLLRWEFRSAASQSKHERPRQFREDGNTGRERPLLKLFQTTAVASLCRRHERKRRVAISPAFDGPHGLPGCAARRRTREVVAIDGAPLPHRKFSRDLKQFQIIPFVQTRTRTLRWCHASSSSRDRFQDHHYRELRRSALRTHP
jgi:hypothetical protein